MLLRESLQSLGHESIRRTGNNCAKVSRSGYIWIWSGAGDQESTNHSARFDERKSRYVTMVYVPENVIQ